MTAIQHISKRDSVYWWRRPIAASTGRRPALSWWQDARGFDQIINVGAGGQTSALMRARYQADVLVHGSCHISIDAGINGVMQGAPLRNTRPTFAQWFRRAWTPVS